MSELRIASVDDFEPQVEVVQLPSQRGTDKAVKLKQPDLVRLIAGDGEVPDVLSAIVSAQINGKPTGDLEITSEMLPQLMQSLDVVALATFVEPALCEGKERLNGAMPVSWLKFDDKAFVFQWALGAEYVPAERFPAKPGADVASVPKKRAIRRRAK